MRFVFMVAELDVANVVFEYWQICRSVSYHHPSSPRGINRSAAAPSRCLSAMPPEGSTRAGMLPGSPSLDRESREAVVGFIFIFIFHRKSHGYSACNQILLPIFPSKILNFVASYLKLIHVSSSSLCIKRVWRETSCMNATDVSQPRSRSVSPVKHREGRVDVILGDEQLPR
ncbi:hypothetical protein CSKR_101400, partial [Clonorchis sinensis]